MKSKKYMKEQIEKEKICPKYGSDKKVKSGFMDRKQRYLCKNCDCHYTGGINGYLESIKIEAIRYYLEGIGFRQIERLLKVGRVSVDFFPNPTQ
jgi:transposase-like protein